MAVADRRFSCRALLWFVMGGCFFAGLLPAATRPETGLHPGPDEPDGKPAPAFWRIEFRHELSRRARLRIRDLSRATELGIARAEQLLAASEEAARRVADTADSPDDARARASQLFEAIWSDAEWSATLAEVLEDEENVLWTERATERRVRRERTARILAATEISDDLHLTSEQRAVVIDCIGDLVFGPPIERMTIIDLQRLWAVGAEPFLQRSLNSAQRRRVSFGTRGNVSPDPRDLHLADLEVWVAKIGDESGIAERDRGILFDCGRRCLAVASIDPASDSEPLEADLLLKALRTIAGPEVAESFRIELHERKGALRGARVEWIIADLDALLFLTEVQRGAIELVLLRAEAGDLLIDAWAPLGTPFLEFSPEIERRLFAILDVDQRNVFRHLLAERKGRR